MSLLLPPPTDPGTAEPRVVGPFYPLNLVERIILILELADEL
jgi:hypothetical protein